MIRSEDYRRGAANATGATGRVAGRAL